MPKPLSDKDRAELLASGLTIECPICLAKVGEECVYKNHGRRHKDGIKIHDKRLLALKRVDKTRYDGRPIGHNVEDLRPIASRRLTLREMRDAGIWVPVRGDNEKRFR